MPNQTTKLIRRLGATPVFLPLRHGYVRLNELQHQQRIQILSEITKMEGLMPLLMKQRNGTPWSSEDRAQIRQRLNSFARLSPYLLALVLPGGLIALPVIAWWLDRRRLRRGNDQSDGASTS
ncbi:MAG: hypothetical protein Q8O37_02295 [Sulfuricellaceae bacterium]|nr:hypothetical protein [Sulfuricellaceae bacterium]